VDVPPSPNPQFQPLIDPVPFIYEESVNCVGLPMHTVVAEKEATGEAVVVVIVIVVSSE
jgi:hypothetical protein